MKKEMSAFLIYWKEEEKIMASKGQKLRRWSKEEKLRIVHLHLSEHQSLREISRNENAHTSLICTWVKNYIKDGEAGLENKRKGNPYLAIQTSKSLDETARLKLIIAKQQVQIERLKKGYTVRGVGANRTYVTINDAITKSSKH